MQAVFRGGQVYDACHTGGGEGSAAGAKPNTSEPDCNHGSKAQHYDVRTCFLLLQVLPVSVKILSHAYLSPPSPAMHLHHVAYTRQDILGNA